MTSGVMAAAISSSIGSVSLPMPRTAFLSMDADSGSMHRSETLLPKGSALMRSPSTSTISSLSRNETTEETTDSTPKRLEVAP